MPGKAEDARQKDPPPLIVPCARDLSGVGHAAQLATGTGHRNQGKEPVRTFVTDSVPWPGASLRQGAQEQPEIPSIDR